MLTCVKFVLVETIDYFCNYKVPHMNNRLLQFMRAENISQAQFADTIGVTRASISHILSGRNKPGYDFLYSVSRHYPALNIDWLITGKGKMYLRNDSRGGGSDDNASSSQAVAARSAAEGTVDSLSVEAGFPAAVQSQVSQSMHSPSIVKVIVFFDDGSYREIK